MRHLQTVCPGGLNEELPLSFFVMECIHISVYAHVSHVDL